MPPLPLSEKEKDVIHRLLIRHFPNLTKDNYELWSECTEEYNCIAFAANIGCQIPWWPADPRYFAGDCYWPPCLPFNDEIENFVGAFQMLRYEKCDSPDNEEGFEKVAIYINPAAKNVLHMARQLESGIWASKLGDWWDIQHQTLGAVESKAYGVAVQIMKRPRVVPL